MISESAGVGDSVTRATTWGRPRVLAVDWSEDLVGKGVRAGIEVVSVADVDAPSFRGAALVDIRLNYDDAELLYRTVSGLHDERPFAAVLGQRERSLIPAARLAARLGVSATSTQTVELLTNKYRFRRLLNAAGISPVAAAVVENADQVIEFGQRHGWPVILKPVAGSASLAINKIEGKEQARRCYEHLRALGLRSVLVEEFLEGPEISVESFSVAGRHFILACTRKIVGENFVEAGHVLPMNLDVPLRDDIDRTVREMLDAVGLRDGPAHTEVKLTSKGPRIIESHNRRGGDNIAALVELSLGYDLEMMELARALGRPVEVADHTPPKTHACISFVMSPAGTVTSVGGVDEAEATPGVVRVEVRVRAGDRTLGTRWSHDRAGYVIATGETPEVAYDAAQTAASRVTIDVHQNRDADENRTVREEEELLAELVRKIDRIRFTETNEAD